MFKIGQKVICINDDFSKIKEKQLGFLLPKKGIIYTVRDMPNHPHKGIRLEEIVNKYYKFRKHGDLITEPAFLLNRFVPIEMDFKKIEFSKATDLVEVGVN